jgi:signal transduction histidine kinase
MTGLPTPQRLPARVIDVATVLLMLTGAVADAIVVATGGPGGDGPRYRFAIGASAALHLACAAACGLRVPRPRLFTAVTVALLGAYVVVQGTADRWLGFPFLALMAPLAVATMARREEDRRIARAVAALACAASLVGPATFGPGDRLSSILMSVLVVLLAWLTGLLLRLRDREARDRRARIARAAVADERERIALDLHDQVGHGLSAIAAQARAGAVLIDRDPAQAREVLERIAFVASETLDATRATVRGLRGAVGGPPDGRQPDAAPPAGIGSFPAPTPPRPTGDPAAPSRVIENLRAAGVEVRATPEDPGDLAALTARWSPAARIALERVVQEGCTNALRHGLPGAPIDVAVRPDGDGGGATVEIANAVDPPASSIPFPRPVRAGSAPGSATDAGTGLVGLRTRVDSVGGELAVSRGDRRFLLRARIPSGEASRKETPR